jgi:hypothetical protein
VTDPRGARHDGVLDIPPLPASTILLVEVGSTAHGTGIPGGEDNDELDVLIESAEEVIASTTAASGPSCNPPNPKAPAPETVTPTAPCTPCAGSSASPPPGTLHPDGPLGPPSYTPPTPVTSCAPSEPAFVGRHVIPRYCGYMQAQTQRLLGL